MNASGIYKIQSISKPERAYIGSAVNINHRWSQHLFDLRKNKHSSLKLQRHYNKYGEYDLEFSIIESGEYLCKQHLLSREQGWYETFQYQNSFLPYFNILPIAGSCLGIKQSEETKQKMKGNKHGVGKRSEEVKHNMRIAWKSRKLTPVSEKARKNMSDSHIGLMAGEKHHMFGKHPSVETRNKQSKAKKGKSNHCLGTKRSIESKQKMRESAKKAWLVIKLKKAS